MKRSEQATFSVLSTDFLRAYVITMRPYLLFVSGVTGAAGLSFINTLPAGHAPLLFTASFLSYGFGQALTDCFQTDTDALSSPYRPLVRGDVTKAHVATMSVVGLTWCVSIFALANPMNLILGALAGVGLATYTPFKRRWWTGPFYNAWIVVVLFLMAHFSGRRDDTPGPTLALAATIITVFFGYANFVLTGYFKDIEADRSTGYNTMPVVWGRSVSARVSDVFAVFAAAGAIVALSAMCVDGFWSPPFAAGLAFLAGGIFASMTAQIRLHAVKKDAEAHAAIVPAVHAYILLLSGIVCAQKPAWVVPLVVQYLLFIAAMRSRIERSQV